MLALRRYPGAAEDDGPANLVQEPRRTGLGLLVAAHIFGHDHELVAAEASHHVAAAGGGLEPLGERAEELVADGVSHPVVHVFESVEVQEHHGHPGPSAPGPGERPPQAFVQEVAVRQTRQRVMEGAEPEAFLLLPLQGDVLHGGDPELNAAIRIRHDGRGHACLE